MANVTLFDQTGKQAGEVVLNDAIFGIEPNQAVVFDVIISQRASLRQGTHAVKNRSAVSGGGRKPWRQKRNWTCSSRFYPLSTMAWCGIVSDQLHVAMRTNFLKKFVALHLNLFTQKKLLKTNCSR